MTKISRQSPINQSITVNRPVWREGLQLGEKIKIESVPFETREFKPMAEATSVFEFLKTNLEALDQRLRKDVLREQETTEKRLQEESTPTRLQEVEKSRKALELHTAVSEILNRLMQLPNNELTEKETQILLEFPKLVDIHSEKTRIRPYLQTLADTLKEKRKELEAPFNALYEIGRLMDGNERLKGYTPDECIHERESWFQEKTWLKKYLWTLNASAEKYSFRDYLDDVFKAFGITS